MSAGNEVFLAGQYTVTWNGTTVGIHEGDSNVPAIDQSMEAELIGNTDAYGKIVVDGVYQGGNFRYTSVMEEWRAGSKAALWPFSANWGEFDVIARLLFAMSQALVLTAITGTPAQAAGDPNTVTASNAILAPGFSSRILFGPTLRKIPMQMLLLPFTSGGKVVAFTKT